MPLLVEPSRPTAGEGVPAMRRALLVSAQTGGRSSSGCPIAREAGASRSNVRRNGVPEADCKVGLPPAHDDGLVSGQRVPGGVVHELPADLRNALIANAMALDAWKDITPLARNEFICWVEDAKQETTRERRIRRTQEELEEGQRRPCCWPGCKHRDRTGR
jgi:hypothetical protein